MQFNQQLLQTIITVIIVLAAASSIVYNVVKSINKPVTGCTGCASECSGCAVTDLKKEIASSKKIKANKETTEEK